ncbi:MAG: YcxB family protein [Ktedonobacteraceae bacterium]|nr:YcxB family protein [Ktedonobacteraceae bacterium]
MEIRFFLTGQDVWNFQKNSLLRPRVLLPMILLLVCIIGIIPILLIIQTSPTNTIFDIAPIVFLLIFICLIVVRLRRRMTSGMARRLAAQGEHTITISPEGFRHTNNLSNSLISWQAIKEIKADAHNLYFIVDNNVLMAHVIPRRAFVGPQDADAFLGWAKSYWAYGHGRPQTGTPGSPTGYEQWG